MLRLKSSRFELRPYLFSDFAKIRASHEARKSTRNSFDFAIPLAAEVEYEKFKDRVLRYRTRAKAYELFAFGIFTEDAYVGQVDLLTINGLLHWGSLGYHIQNQFFGQGFATEASGLILKAGFTQLKYHRIEATMVPRNRASRQVAVRLGMRCEGLREKFFAHDGGRDMVVYATNAIDFRGP